MPRRVPSPEQLAAHRSTELQQDLLASFGAFTIAAQQLNPDILKDDRLHHFYEVIAAKTHPDIIVEAQIGPRQLDIPLDSPEQ